MVLVGPELPRIEQVGRLDAEATDELCGPWLLLGRAQGEVWGRVLQRQAVLRRDAEEAHDLLATGLARHDHPRRLGQEAAVVALAMLPLAVPAHLGEPRLHAVLEVEDLADEGKVHVLDIGREPDEVDSVPLEPPLERRRHVEEARSHQRVLDVVHRSQRERRADGREPARMPEQRAFRVAVVAGAVDQELVLRLSLDPLDRLEQHLLEGEAAADPAPDLCDDHRDLHDGDPATSRTWKVSAPIAPSV